MASFDVVISDVMADFDLILCQAREVAAVEQFDLGAQQLHLRGAGLLHAVYSGNKLRLLPNYFPKTFPA